MQFGKVLGKWAVLVVTVEVGGFAAFYYVWHNMNTSQGNLPVLYSMVVTI